MAEDGGDRVGDEDDGEQQEDALGVAVGAEEHERPDGDRGDRHREVARDAEEVEGGGDAAELGDHQADVGDGEGGDGEGGEPEGELLADEGGQALAGVDGQAGHHLLHDDVGDRDEHHQEERPVDELRPGRRVGDDAAGVVAGGGGDQPGPGRGQVDQPPPAGPLRVHDRQAWEVEATLGRHQGVEHVVGQDAPDRAAVVVDHHQREPPRLDQLRGHLVGRGVRAHRHHVLVAQQRRDPRLGSTPACVEQDRRGG